MKTNAASYGLQNLPTVRRSYNTTTGTCTFNFVWVFLLLFVCFYKYWQIRDWIIRSPDATFVLTFPKLRPTRRESHGTVVVVVVTARYTHNYTLNTICIYITDNTLCFLPYHSRVTTFTGEKLLLLRYVQWGEKLIPSSMSKRIIFLFCCCCCCFIVVVWYNLVGDITLIAV